MFTRVLSLVCAFVCAVLIWVGIVTSFVLHVFLNDPDNEHPFELTKRGVYAVHVFAAILAYASFNVLISLVRRCRVQARILALAWLPAVAIICHFSMRYKMAIYVPFNLASATTACALPSLWWYDVFAELLLTGASFVCRRLPVLAGAAIFMVVEAM